MTKAKSTFIKLAGMRKEAISTKLFRNAILKRVSKDGYDPKSLNKTKDQMIDMFSKHTNSGGKSPKPSSYNEYGRTLSGGSFADTSADILEDLVNPKLQNTLKNRVARIRGKKVNHMDYDRDDRYIKLD